MTSTTNCVHRKRKAHTQKQICATNLFGLNELTKKRSNSLYLYAVEQRGDHHYMYHQIYVYIMEMEVAFDEDGLLVWCGPRNLWTCVYPVINLWKEPPHQTSRLYITYIANTNQTRDQHTLIRTHTYHQITYYILSHNQTDENLSIYQKLQTQSKILTTNQQTHFAVVVS